MTKKRGPFEQKKDTAIDIEKAKCSKCNRGLRSSDNWVGDQNTILCKGCYQDLAFPFSSTSYDLQFN
jgi:formylmethanofuran dehydrogenase subunit E